jgi:hypothetical protein
MTTNDSNAILFTKTIRDLAHFASLRLQYLADKVKYIDHLLPDESDSLGRQKRFPDDPDSLEREQQMITLVPWIICIYKLKTTKASTLEDECILRREIFKYIKENEWVRSELHACRNPPYPDFDPENFDPLVNTTDSEISNSTHPHNFTSSHLIFSPRPFTTQIICQNGSHYPVQLINTQKIFIPDYCSITLS